METGAPRSVGLTAETGSECAGRVLRHFPVFTSQILTLSSNCRQRRDQATHREDRSGQTFGTQNCPQTHPEEASTLTEPETMRLDCGLKLQQKT